MRKLLLALALFCVPAFAAQLIIDIPACTNYVLSGNTVTCTSSGIPPPVIPPPITPPPPGSGALADFDYRASVGQWAAWKFWDAAATDGLLARGHSMLRINQQINFYNHDLSLPGNRVGNSFRCFSVTVGNFIDDVGEACDREIAKLAAAQGRPVPGPVK